MELQDSLTTLPSRNIEPYAISYDSPETLSGFADKQKITYPLLSDPDSRVIREFGILNTLVPEDNRRFGMPFPGSYTVDEHGTVFDKSFYADHAVRDSVFSVIQEKFEIQDAERGTVQVVETGAARVSAWLSADTIRRGQVHTLTVEIQVREGLHIYGNPLPPGYVATRLTFDDLEDVQFDEVSYPDPRPVYLEASSETVQVYEGIVVLKTQILSKRRESFSVRAHLDIQACDDRECLLPETVDLELPLKFLEMP